MNVFIGAGDGHRNGGAAPHNAAGPDAKILAIVWIEGFIDDDGKFFEPIGEEETNKVVRVDDTNKIGGHGSKPVPLVDSPKPSVYLGPARRASQFCSSDRTDQLRVGTKVELVMHLVTDSDCSAPDVIEVRRARFVGAEGPFSIVVERKCHARNTAASRHRANALEADVFQLGGGFRHPGHEGLLIPRSAVKAEALSSESCQPGFDCPNGAQPLCGCNRYAGSRLMSGESPDGDQRRTFGFGDCSGSVNRRLLARQAIDQLTSFPIGADRGDFQDGPAVSGFDEALFVVQSRGQVKLVRNAQSPTLVDGNVEQAVAGLVPDPDGSSFFEAVMRFQQRFDAGHVVRKRRMPFALRRAHQRCPTSRDAWHDRDRGAAKAGLRKSLIEKPDQLIGFSALLGHKRQTLANAGLLSSRPSRWQEQLTVKSLGKQTVNFQGKAEGIFGSCMIGVAHPCEGQHALGDPPMRTRGIFNRAHECRGAVDRHDSAAARRGSYGEGTKSHGTTLSVFRSTALRCVLAFAGLVRLVQAVSESVRRFGGQADGLVMVDNGYGLGVVVPDHPPLSRFFHFEPHRNLKCSLVHSGSTRFSFVRGAL